jgi:hypothetical protein
MKTASGLAAVALAAVAIVSFVFVRSHASDAGSLPAAQRSVQALSADTVARLVRLAPNGVTGKRGLNARCRPLGVGALKNPWRCLIDYGGGRKAQYTVHVNANGSFVGTDQVAYFNGRAKHTRGSITGCCINLD